MMQPCVMYITRLLRARFELRVVVISRLTIPYNLGTAMKHWDSKFFPIIGVGKSRLAAQYLMTRPSGNYTKVLQGC